MISVTKPISVDEVFAILCAARCPCREAPAHGRMSALREAAIRVADKREVMAHTIVTEGVKTIREARRSLEAPRSNPAVTSRP